MSKIKITIPVAINENGQHCAKSWGDPKKCEKEGLKEDYDDMESQAVEALYMSFSDETPFNLCKVVYVEVEIDIPEVMKAQGSLIKVKDIPEE